MRWTLYETKLKTGDLKLRDKGRSSTLRGVALTQAVPSCEWLGNP